MDIKEKLQNLKDALITNEVEITPTDIEVKKDCDKHKPDALTLNQLKFIDEYLIDGNQTQAAIRAGYKSPSAQGSRLLNNETIKAEIKKRQDEITKKKGYTREYFINKLEELIEDCYTDEKTDRASILKAYDMIIKMVGYYSPDTLVQVNNNVNEIKITVVK